MTTFSGGVNTPASTLATNLTTVVGNAKTLSDALTPASIGSLSLNNLATSTTSWRSNVADLRIQLADAMRDLGSVNDRIQRIVALIGNIATLD